jgi:hypothetical protein
MADGPQPSYLCFVTISRAFSNANLAFHFNGPLGTLEGVGYSPGLFFA